MMPSRFLKGVRHKYEEHHKAEFTDKAVEASVKLSDRYITDRFLPDKAIDVLDKGAGSRARISTMIRVRRKARKTDGSRDRGDQRQKGKAIKNQDFRGRSADALTRKSRRKRKAGDASARNRRAKGEEKRIVRG